jgi:hypothetical protein
MKTKIFSIFILFTLINCTEKQKLLKVKTETSTVLDYSKSFENKELMRSLYVKISNEGDTSAYENLKSIYFLSGHRLDFLNVSVLMSNRYKYEMAYYDVFTGLYKLNSKDDKSENWIFDNGTDSFTLKYALENLKKAANLGNNDAKKIIDIYNVQNRYVSLFQD